MALPSSNAADEPSTPALADSTPAPQTVTLPRSVRRTPAPLRLRVKSLALGGEGVAHLEAENGHRAVFLPATAPGDLVDADVDLSRKPARGRVLRLIEPSNDRVEPPCPEIGLCGGCDFMHIRPDGQAKAHAEMVHDALSRVIGELPPITTHLAPRTERYRTRARLALHANGSRAVVGYRPPRSHRAHDIADCLVLDERLTVVLGLLRELLAKEKGEGEASIALGADERPVIELRWRGDLRGELFAVFDDLVSRGVLAGVDIWMGEVKKPARIGNPSALTIGGDGEPLLIPSGGFAQAQPELSRRLAERALALLEPDGEDVLELFSGSGNFTVALARVARSVTAVESDADAAEAARSNLRARGLEAKVVTADADAFEIPAKARRILLDPPRAGASGASRLIAASRARRVVYASCDPGTLARDLHTLTAARFRLTEISTFEMFPHTSHVETLVALERAR